MNHVLPNTEKPSHRWSHLPSQKLPRRTNNLPYSTELQRRRKAELRALRSEDQRLSDQLKFLVPANNPPASGRASVEWSEGQAQWHRKAMTECKGRVLAECTNRELNEILAQVPKLFKAAQKVLSHSDTLEGMGFVSLLQPTADRALAWFDISGSIFAELSGKVGHLYLQTNCMLPPPSDDVAVSIRTQTRLHETHGIFFETTASTSMACTTKEAEQIFWDEVASEGLKKIFFSGYDRVINHDSVSCDINFASTLFTRDDDTNELLHIESMGTIQRCQEGNRMVVIGSTRWLVPSHGVQLEDVFWIVVGPSALDPAHSSIIQSKYQLQVTNPGWRSPKAPLHTRWC